MDLLYPVLIKEISGQRKPVCWHIFGSGHLDDEKVVHKKYSIQVNKEYQISFYIVEDTLPTDNAKEEFYHTKYMQL